MGHRTLTRFVTMDDCLTRGQLFHRQTDRGTIVRHGTAISTTGEASAQRSLERLKYAGEAEQRPDAAACSTLTLAT